MNHGPPAPTAISDRRGGPEWSKRLSNLPGTHNARYNLPTELRLDAMQGSANPWPNMVMGRKFAANLKRRENEYESLHYAAL